MCIECGLSANGQECDRCFEPVCDDCVIDDDSSGDMFCSDWCADA